MEGRRQAGWTEETLRIKTRSLCPCIPTEIFSHWKLADSKVPFGLRKFLEKEEGFN